MSVSRGDVINDVRTDTEPASARCDAGRREMEADLVSRFLAHAKAFIDHELRNPRAEPGTSLSYMDALYADALGRVARDVRYVRPGEHYDRLAMQPLIFARLAGFLAAHLVPQDDHLRKTIDAVLCGYAEPDSMDGGP
jgi:hypothetical protein